MKRAGRQAGFDRLKSASAYGDIRTTAPEAGRQRELGSPALLITAARRGGRRPRVLMTPSEGAIVFFDKLGFGWVIDRRVLTQVKLGVLAEEDLPNRSLIEMIETILSGKPII
jgi:hypothetical protein